MDTFDLASLFEWAEKIDGPLGPISGRDADFLAKLLRHAGHEINRLKDAREQFRWRHIRMGQPAPVGDTHVVIAAKEYEYWRLEHAELRTSLRDESSRLASQADESAFWHYQAIWGRAYLLDPKFMSSAVPEDTAVWKEATKQLEEARVEENRERFSHAEAPRDPGGT